MGVTYKGGMYKLSPQDYHGRCRAFNLPPPPWSRWLTFGRFTTYTVLILRARSPSRGDRDDRGRDATAPWIDGTPGAGKSVVDLHPIQDGRVKSFGDAAYLSQPGTRAVVLLVSRGPDSNALFRRPGRTLLSGVDYV